MVESNKQETDNARLFQEVKKGNSQRVRELIAQGADVNAEDDAGCSPLHYAVKSNYVGEEDRWVDSHRDIVELLVEKGADINARDKDRNTPLHMAMSSHSKDIPALLIDKGAYLNPRNNYGKMPLHVAAGSVSPATEVVECLVEMGADINVRNKKGRTPLHMVAAESQSNVSCCVPLAADRFLAQIRVARMLVGKGAKLDARDKDGMTPRELAPGYHDYDSGFVETEMQRILKGEEAVVSRGGARGARNR